MSALSVVRGGAIGIAAVVIPSIALGVTTAYIIAGLPPFLGLLGVTLILVGGLAWVCVRVAHFSPRLAVVLTTFPFGAILVLTLSALVKGNGGGFVICLGQLALAVSVAWVGTLLARR